MQHSVLNLLNLNEFKKWFRNDSFLFLRAFLWSVKNTVKWASIQGEEKKKKLNMDNAFFCVQKQSE